MSKHISQSSSKRKILFIAISFAIAFALCFSLVDAWSENPLSLWEKILQSALLANIAAIVGYLVAFGINSNISLYASVYAIGIVCLLSLGIVSVTMEGFADKNLGYAAIIGSFIAVIKLLYDVKSRKNASKL